MFLEITLQEQICISFGFILQYLGLFLLTNYSDLS